MLIIFFFSFQIVKCLFKPKRKLQIYELYNNWSEWHEQSDWWSYQKHLTKSEAVLHIAVKKYNLSVIELPLESKKTNIFFGEHLLFLAKFLRFLVIYIDFN